jgi:hypothetical protein
MGNKVIASLFVVEILNSFEEFRKISEFLNSFEEFE